MKDSQEMETEEGQDAAGALQAEAGDSSRLRKSPVGVRLCFGRWNILGASAVLILAAALYALNASLFWEAEPTGWLPVHGRFTAAYAALAIGGVLLCFLEFRLPETARRAAGWLLVLAAPVGAFFAVDLINSTRILTFSPMRGFANYLCYLMVFAFLYALTRRAWAAVLAGGAIFLMFGSVNYFVVQFRGQPILPLDIQSMGTAAEVAGRYKFAFTQPMLLSLMALVCAVALCVRLEPHGGEKASWRSRLAERLCALALSGVLAVLIFPCDALTSMGISVWPWNQKTSSEITGVLAGFFGNVQFMMVDKPEDYSEEEVEKLGEELSRLEEPSPLGDPQEDPTIIVVMNESMTDFKNVGNAEFAPDNLPFLHSLQGSENVIWGTAYSSVFGGNTCNSEYEFLTGNTTAFFPVGSIPYQQYVTHEQTALPSILKSYGYSCTAIHPGNRGAWQRDKAYPNLGFDEFIAARDFDVPRKPVHNLTSDESCYDQVIYEYEHRDEGVPQFLFTVTIQNHGGFEDEDVPVTVRVGRQTGENTYEGEVMDPQGGSSPVTVQFEGQEGDAQAGESVYPQTEQYLSLTKLSDQALEGLVDYFEKREDPVLILFFGDHWPNLESGFVSELLDADANDLEFEDMMRKHQVPFLLWANYPLEGQYIENISLNYLSGLLLRAAGLEGTDYTAFLESLRQQVPVVTAVGSIDREGNAYQNGGETPYDQLLNQYAILQYNNAFGGEEKVDEIFTRQEGKR